MLINNPVITGSFTVNGTNFITNTPSTGSNTFNGNQIISGSAIVTGSLQVTGSVTTTGTITAQTLVVQTVTSSVVYSSGSNTFGNSLSNNQIFTGSAYFTGSNHIIQGSVGIGTSSPSTKLTIESSTFDDFIKLTRTGIGSMGISATNPRGIQTTDGAGNFLGWHVSSSGYVGIGTTSPSGKLHVYGQANYNDGLYVSNPGLNGASITLSSTDTGGLPFTIISTASSNGPGAGTLSIYDGTAYRFTLKSGNVGIGTSSPQFKLHVSNATGDDASFVGGILIENTGTPTGEPTLAFKNIDTSTNYFLLGLNQSDNFSIAYGTTFTDANTKFRVTTGGNVLIGSVTDLGYRLYVQGGGGQGAGWMQQDSAPPLYLNRTGNDGGEVIFLKAGTQVGYIGTNAYSLPSDANFKKNIDNLELGLNLVSKLRPVSYNHKIDDDDAALSTGFIAQELEQSLVELGVEQNKYYILQHVPNEKEGESQYWLDYQKMIPVLVKAIQEQQAQIEVLKTEIETLKNK